MASTFNITDADIQNSLQHIENHSTTMRSTMSRVDGISNDVGTAYRSTASNAFQGHLAEWGEAYGELHSAVRTLHANLNQAHSGINSTADDAVQQAGALSGSISGILAG